MHHMRTCLLACLLGTAACLQVEVAPPEARAEAEAAGLKALASSVDLSSVATAAASSVGVALSPEQAAGLLSRVGDYVKQNAPRTKHAEITRNLAQEKVLKREAMAPSRLDALRASLPQMKQTAAELCGAGAAGLCEVRMKMFDALAGKVEGGDLEVVELLRKSSQLLHDFMQTDQSLRGAISSLTLQELVTRPPAGMKLVADINPQDGNVDRYELSEYMKATYLFTLTDATASALEMKHGKSSNKMRKFISWETRDVPSPKPAPEEAAPPREAPAPVDAAPEEAALPAQAPEGAPAPEEAAAPPQEALTPEEAAE